MINASVIGQSYNRFNIGSSLTYIRDNDKYTYYNYDEFTWNLNVSVNITKRIQFGVQALSIFADGGNTGYDYYHIVGCFMQLYYIQKQSIGLFLETSINNGNFYFPLAQLYPSKLDNLNYIGIGGGGEIPLVKDKNLFLDISFVSYYTLFQDKKFNAFTQYIIGVNYKFGN
ncbi:MAG: hypothetical protein JXR64_09055 [Spirochaetales bacterium]|nr:hypothetical protein [Spirochaetales bacterium]